MIRAGVLAAVTVRISALGSGRERRRGPHRGRQPMRIREVTIRNFRAIESLELPLHPELTVLFGPNRCGKTSVLRAITRAVEACMAQIRDDPPFPADPDDFRAGNGTPIIQLEFEDRRPISILGNRQQKEWDTPEDQVLFPLELPADAGADHLDVNLAVFYGTERAIGPIPQLDSEALRAELRQMDAFDDAFSMNADFRRLLEWFQRREYQEFTEQRDRRDHDFRLRDLSAVRDAILRDARRRSQSPFPVRPVAFRGGRSRHG